MCAAAVDTLYLNGIVVYLQRGAAAGAGQGQQAGRADARRGHVDPDPQAVPGSFFNLSGVKGHNLGKERSTQYEKKSKSSHN